MDTVPPVRLADATRTPPAETESAPAPEPSDALRWSVERWATEAIAKHATRREQCPRWLKRELREYAAALAGAHPTPIELTLAQTAALTWLVLRVHEVNAFAASNRPMHQADYDLRRLNASHRRHLTALRTLETVRRLARPTLMPVNVGRQVNAAV